MRVLVFEESGAVVAQCLEKDVAAQGRSVGGAIKALELALNNEVAINEVLLPALPHAPAPECYHLAWARSPLEGQALPWSSYWPLRVRLSAEGSPLRRAARPDDGPEEESD